MTPWIKLSGMETTHYMWAAFVFFGQLNVKIRVDMLKYKCQYDAKVLIHNLTVLLLIHYMK